MSFDSQTSTQVGLVEVRRAEREIIRGKMMRGLEGKAAGIEQAFILSISPEG
jgi:hypothetical protein